MPDETTPNDNPQEPQEPQGPPTPPEKPVEKPETPQPPPAPEKSEEPPKPEPQKPEPAEKPATPPQPESPKPQPPQQSPAPEKPAAAPEPAVAPQSAPALAPAPASMTRRSFIKWATIGWAAFAGVVGGYLTMVMRFFFPNVLFEPAQSFQAGFPDEYQSGEVSERWKDKHAVWIVRDEGRIYALSTTCTHLGCTPNWLANDNKFKCPCHGSGFYKTGINFEGPAPRPLERYRISLGDDGKIVVDKTRKYQQEKGEWKDPESYLVV